MFLLHWLTMLLFVWRLIVADRPPLRWISFDSEQKKTPPPSFLNEVHYLRLLVLPPPPVLTAQLLFETTILY